MLWAWKMSSGKGSANSARISSRVQSWRIAPSFRAARGGAGASSSAIDMFGRLSVTTWLWRFDRAAQGEALAVHHHYLDLQEKRARSPHAFASALMMKQ